MKIILTGATGLVGSEILSQLLRRNDVDTVTCLTRSPLSLQSPKVRTILHADFNLYPADLAQQLATHDALLWALGGKACDEADGTAYERATIACATAIAARVTHRFRFGYLSGMGADPTGTATFPWQKRTRVLNGSNERALQQLTATSPGFCATCFRPARILPKSTSGWIDQLLFPIAVRVDRLAHTMIEEAVRNIAERYAVLDNSTIRKIADPSH